MALSKPARLAPTHKPHSTKVHASKIWVYALHHTLHDSPATTAHGMSAVYTSLSTSIPSHRWLSVDDLLFNDTQVLVFPPAGGLVNVTEAWPGFYHVQSHVEALMRISRHPFCGAVEGVGEQEQQQQQQPQLQQQQDVEGGEAAMRAWREVVRQACLAYWQAGMITAAGEQIDRSAYPMGVSMLLALRRAGKKCMFVAGGQADPAMEWWIRTEHSMWFFELGMFCDTEEGVAKADGLVEMLLRRIEDEPGKEQEGEIAEGWEHVVVVGDDWEMDVLPALALGVGLVIFVSPSESCPEVVEQYVDKVCWVRNPIEVNAVLRFQDLT